VDPTRVAPALQVLETGVLLLTLRALVDQITFWANLSKINFSYEKSVTLFGYVPISILLIRSKKKWITNHFAVKNIDVGTMRIGIF
jgi:hypothetical protein